MPTASGPKLIKPTAVTHPSIPAEESREFCDLPIEFKKLTEHLIWFRQRIDFTLAIVRQLADIRQALEASESALSIGPEPSHRGGKREVNSDPSSSRETPAIAAAPGGLNPLPQKALASDYVPNLYMPRWRAAFEHLRQVGKAQTIHEILAGLAAKGYPVSSKNPSANLTSELSRHDEFHRLGRGTWALRAWEGKR